MQSSRRLTATLAALALSLAACASHGGSTGPSDAHSPALYTGEGDAVITKCQKWSYGDSVDVDVAWNVTNSDAQPHDYALNVSVASGVSKTEQVPSVDAGASKSGQDTLTVSRTPDGSWPAFDCKVTAITVTQ